MEGFFFLQQIKVSLLLAAGFTRLLNAEFTDVTKHQVVN